MRDTLDMELLQTLAAIADTGSFAGAAESVHRTQSAVSMQMKRLEDIVNQPLFEKRGRRAMLTAQGQNLLLYARRILSLQDEALAVFRSPDIQGEVKLGVCDDYVMSYMPPILASYAQKYPNVHVQLDAQTSTRLIAATARGELDFSLVNVINSDVEYEKLKSDSLVWVTSRHHLAHEMTPLPLGIESNCLWGNWAQQALDKAGIHYRLAYSTFNIGGVVAIIEAGLAVSIMSSSSVLPNMRILGKAEGFPDLPITSIGLVKNKTSLTPAAEQLANSIRQRLGQESMAA